jgi:hypothetical protein|tara:strand:+ start:6210 stop:6533 length:324 start_codon:yes stop_codon:yes gene_type:complete
MSDKKLSISASRPQVMTANRLVDGVVVYFTAAGTWSERFEDAVRDGQLDSAEARRAAAQSPAFAEQVVGAYPFEVDGESGEPLSVREIIRAAGPSVRPDLGKQAALR